MPNIKVVIGFAAIAAVLSLFAGIFGGVTFGVIFLRMILGALAFGALGAGASLLIERFMPDLFLSDQQERSSSDAEEGSQQGSQVDIVLDNEGEDEPDFSSNTGEEQAEDEEDRFIEEVYRSGDEESGERAPSGAGDAANENGEAAVSSGAGGAEEAGVAQAPADEASSVGTSGGSGSDSREEKGAFENVADIDELPDLEEYADSFESVAADNPTEGGQQSGGTSSSNFEIDGQQEDPATVAKALRQFMKKDEEG